MPITELKLGADVSAAIRLHDARELATGARHAQDIGDELAQWALRAPGAGVERQPRRTLALRDHQGEHQDSERLRVRATEPVICADDLFGEVQALIAEVAAPCPEPEPAEHRIGLGAPSNRTRSVPRG